MSSENKSKPNSFSLERLEKLAEMEQRHFWFVGRRRLLDQLISRYVRSGQTELLDVGCGTGSMLQALLGRGFRTYGADQRPEGLVQAIRSNRSLSLAQATATSLPFKGNQFDVVLALDLIEHVDDRTCLQEISRVLGPGGRLLVTVPAFDWLWSFRDEAAGHRRRYSRNQLVARLNEAGFVLEHTAYFNFLLFPLVLSSRLLGRRQRGFRDLEDEPLGFMNTLLTQVIKLETWLGKLIKWPVGSTIAAVCRKHP